MPAKELGGAFRVALLAVAEQRAVVAHRVVHRLGDEQADIALRGQPDLVEHSLDPRGRSRLEQRPVEVTVEIPEDGGVMIVRDRLERLERAPDDVDLLGRHRLDGAADHLALDDPAKVVQPAQIVEVDAGGDGGALRQGDDQPFALEPAHGLADRNMADAEPLLELGDLDPLTGLISPASRSCRSRSVTLSTMLTRWMVSLRAGSMVESPCRVLRYSLYRLPVAARSTPGNPARRGCRAGSERGPARLHLGGRVEQALRRPQREALAPRRRRELHPDRDAERVEPGADGAGREADEILRRRVAHHELAERQLLALVDDRLVADREWRSGAHGSEQHVAGAEQAGEGGAHATAVCRRGEVLLDASPRSRRRAVRSTSSPYSSRRAG